MAAGKLNLEIEQGATFRRAITVTDVNGVAINLANTTIEGKAKQRLNSSEYLFSFTISDRIDNQGKFTISLSANQTSLLDFSTGVYDIEIQFLEGTIIRLLEGSVVLNKGVTL